MRRGSNGRYKDRQENRFISHEKRERFFLAIRENFPCVTSREEREVKISMREIKFRGKRVDNGEWVYGYYYTQIITHAGNRKSRDHFMRTEQNIRYVSIHAPA